jgi:hypothetical protein
MVMTAILQVIKEPKEHDLYIDNYFTPYELLRQCADIGLRCTETIRANRTSGCPLPKKFLMEKRGRGSFSSVQILCM